MKGQKVTIDEEYIEKLYEKTVALEKLDQISLDKGKITFSALPSESIALVICVAICWVGMAIYVIVNKNNKKKS